MKTSRDDADDDEPHFMLQSRSVSFSHTCLSRLLNMGRLAAANPLLTDPPTARYSVSPPTSVSLLITGRRECRGAGHQQYQQHDQDFVRYRIGKPANLSAPGIVRRAGLLGVQVEAIPPPDRLRRIPCKFHKFSIRTKPPKVKIPF